MGVGYLTGQGGGVSNIKSIQRGSFSTTLGVSSYDLTISSVDMTKSIVMISCDNRTYPQTGTFHAKLTTATNINIAAISSDASFVSYLTWQVIEFNNVKSLQTGTIAFSTSETIKNVTISSINQQKAIVIANMRTQDNSNVQGSEYTVTFELTSATNIKLTRQNVFATNASAYWQLIEFK